MKNRVVPALLSDKIEGYRNMINTCKSFTDYVQIDLMDGEFVSSKSVMPEDLKEINSYIKNEAHLMVNDPLYWLDELKKCKTYKVIFHYEIDKNHEEIIKEIKKNKFKAGLAINPSTEIEEIEYLIHKIDSVLFMSVEPGRYGAPFIPSVLEKIRKFREEHPLSEIGIDGGIKLDNLEQVVKSGIDYACVGSAILKAKNPREEYLKFNADFKSWKNV